MTRPLLLAMFLAATVSGAALAEPTTEPQQSTTESQPAAGPQVQRVMIPGGDGEAVTIRMPQGWILANRGERDGIAVLEWIPSGQTLTGWTDIITLQRLPGITDVAPAEMLDRMVTDYRRACADMITGTRTVTAIANFPVAVHLVACPDYAATRQSEITLFTGIAGENSFYLLQRAWRRAPFQGRDVPLTDAEMQEGGRQIGDVSACRLGDPAAPCAPAIVGMLQALGTSADIVVWTDDE
jgi:hypothetical protein